MSMGRWIAVLLPFAFSITIQTAAHAETAEQRAVRAAAFEAAYRVLDPSDSSSNDRFRQLVEAEVHSGVSIDEFLGFMIDSGLDCQLIELPVGPANQPPVEYFCSYSFVSPEEADRLAWSSQKKVSRVGAVARIDNNRTVTQIDAGTTSGMIGP